MMITRRDIFIITISFLFLLVSSNTFAQTPKPLTTEPAPKVNYKIALYAQNTMYQLEPDGSSKRKLFEKSGIIDFRALPQNKLLVHSEQYDGESLEIFDIDANIWSLIEFTEGDIPNVAISEDGSTVAYEIRHFPISIDGDGIWIYAVSGKKNHVKVSGTALSIESIMLYSGRLYVLFHELDLVSDESGLFIESYPLDNSQGKTRRERIPEGTKLFVDGGHSLGFVYPSSGKQMELRHMETSQSFKIDVPSGDIILSSDSYLMGNEPKVVIKRNAIETSESSITEIFQWDIKRKKLEPLPFEGLSEITNIKWSPDGILYFVASYQDPSLDLSSPMLFKIQLSDKSIELIAIQGGLLDFQIQ